MDLEVKREARDPPGGRPGLQAGWWAPTGVSTGVNSYWRGTSVTVADPDGWRVVLFDGDFAP